MRNSPIPVGTVPIYEVRGTGGGVHTCLRGEGRGGGADLGAGFVC